jgi:hypothetical protein
MDFLDPNYERRSQLRLLVGYCLITLVIVIVTRFLLLSSIGYGVNSKGQITRSGLVFISSQPSGATLSLNGVLYASQTNTRVSALAGSYTMQLSHSGYRDWTRPIYIAGGDVQHFDYPFLFPNKLQTTSAADLNATPRLFIQSPDHRWLLIDHPDSAATFTLYDLKDPKQPVSNDLTLPAGSFTPGDGPQEWALEEWASDSRHVVLLHTYTFKGTTSHEYVLVDRASPTDSVDLTTTLKLTQDQSLTLFNNRISQYYVYDSSSQSLQRINASDGSLVSILQHVLAYKTYADKQILYVTDQPQGQKVPAGQVSVVLQDGQQSYTLRTLPTAPSYTLSLAQYDGDWYVAVGASNDSAVYIYKNPQNQLTANDNGYPAPWRRMAITSPTYVSFSSNTQFLVAESGQNFVVYDLENVDQYRYTAKSPLDQPQLHATWMDGDRLMYVSGGKLVVFDYDNRNRQTLMSALSTFTPVFDGGYTHVFAIAPSARNASAATLSSTWLLAPADQ